MLSFTSTLYKSHPPKEQNTDITMENYKGGILRWFLIFMHSVEFLKICRMMTRTPREKTESTRTICWEVAWGEADTDPHSPAGGMLCAHFWWSAGGSGQPGKTE